MLFTLTWKNDVEPRVIIGERTSGLEITWIRKTSESDRLHFVSVMNSCCRQLTYLTSERNNLDIRTWRIVSKVSKGRSEMCLTSPF